MFDTETIGLEKRFCYDLGYGIYDRKGNPMVERQFIIEQIWNNKPLFETAYYAEKKELYVSKLRGRTAVLEKVGDMLATALYEIFKRLMSKNCMRITQILICRFLSLMLIGLKHEIP